MIAGFRDRAYIACRTGVAPRGVPSLGTILQRADLVVLEAPLESLCIKGSALISTDLSKARYAAIDATLRQATLLLPLPTALWARLDSQQSKVHRLSRQGLRFMMIGDAGESELMELAWREAEQGFMLRAVEPALIRQAQDQAVVALQQLFAHNGWSVKVVWQ